MKKILIICGAFMLGLLVFNTISTQHITLIADPAVLQIPIHENHEPMIDLRDQTLLAFGPSPEIKNNRDYTKMRQSVYEKLVQAQKTLPDGLRFCIYEAYRSLALQEQLFNRHYHDLKSAHPDMNDQALFKETTKLVSPVINQDGTRNIPPHATGAAVDIYLIDTKGNRVDMGIFTEDWMKDMDGSLSMTDSKKISPAAIKYRKIMSKALEDAGFVNYPTEYWHWSYGDRYWAYVKKQPNAIYGQ